MTAIKDLKNYLRRPVRYADRPVQLKIHFPEEPWLRTVNPAVAKALGLTPGDAISCYATAMDDLKNPQERIVLYAEGDFADDLEENISNGEIFLIDGTIIKGFTYENEMSEDGIITTKKLHTGVLLKSELCPISDPWYREIFGLPAEEGENEKGDNDVIVPKVSEEE